MRGPASVAVLVRKRWAVLLAALVPFAALCFSVALWDRIEPMIFGLPFNFFWLIAWTVLTSACLAAAYRLGGYGSLAREETRES